MLPFFFFLPKIDLCLKIYFLLLQCFIYMQSRMAEKQIFSVKKQKNNWHNKPIPISAHQICAQLKGCLQHAHWQGIFEHWNFENYQCTRAKTVLLPKQKKSFVRKSSKRGILLSVGINILVFRKMVSCHAVNFSISRKFFIHTTCSAGNGGNQRKYWCLECMYVCMYVCM